MAEIILKGLEVIPTVENSKEASHFLAEKDGAYVRVPSDQVAGSEALNVLFRIDSKYNEETEEYISTITCNKTYDEILAAWGKVPVNIAVFRRGDEDNIGSYAEASNLSYYWVTDDGSGESLWFAVSFDYEKLLYYPDGTLTFASGE